MPFDGKKSHEFFTKIAFERVGGSKEEKRAADIIAGEVKKIGLKPTQETFQMRSFDHGTAWFETQSPYKKKYEVKPMGFSGASAGISGELVYIENNIKNLPDAKNKIAMVYGGLKPENYEKLVKMKCKGLIYVWEPTRPLIRWKMSWRMVKQFGRIPAVGISYDDAMELIKRKAKNVRFGLKQKDFDATSRNVIAEVKGTDFPEEIIVVCGHFDSVMDSEGAHDNGGGSAVMFELARQFNASPLRRTLRFVWFGSEELGLLGSEAYCKKHKTQLDKVKMVINIDVAGGIIGINGGVITGSDALKNYVEALGKEMGLSLNIAAGAYSSDSIPFAEADNIPSVNVYRSGGGCAFCHSSGDKPEYVGPEGLQPTGDFSHRLIKRLGNAIEFPFDREYSETVRKAVDDYLKNRMLRKDVKKAKKSKS